MRTRLSLCAVLTTLVMAGTACSGDSEADDVAVDPAPTSDSSERPEAPAAPVPDGEIVTRNLATVMDTGSPELCLGAVAESYPPQCGGPPLVGWDWADHEGTYEEEGGVRWGTYVVTGTWDGSSMTPTEAISGALYDPAMPTETPTPAAATEYTEAELQRISDELRDLLPGYLGSYGGEGTDGHVLADVYYDDGSLQAWADETYGANVVVVSAALVDVRAR
jgi:hypothetical protein